MSRRAIFLFYCSFIALQLLYLSSILLISAYYDPANKMGYATPIELGSVASKVGSVPMRYLIEAINAWEIINIGSMLVGVVVFFITSSNKYSRLRLYYFAAQPLILYSGVLGLLQIPDTLRDITGARLDGEWLAEHWPTSICVGLWILLSLIIAYLSRGKDLQDVLEKDRKAYGC